MHARTRTHTLDVAQSPVRACEQNTTLLRHSRATLNQDTDTVALRPLLMVKLIARASIVNDSLAVSKGPLVTMSWVPKTHAHKMPSDAMHRNRLIVV